MKRAIDVPPFGELADPRVLAELAAAAEERGWDGFFVWDHILHRSPERAIADPWIALAAVACATSTLRIGPMVTPLARRRVHKLAKETVTLDILSSGRLTLGVGLGSARNGELEPFGEVTDARERARLLDSGLTDLTRYWSGDLEPLPVQRPRIPVWVAGEWPYRRPVERALRWDGYFPTGLPGPEALAGVTAEIRRALPSGAPFDVVVDLPPGEDTGPWERAGATWAVTDLGLRPSRSAVLAVIHDGPSHLPCAVLGGEPVAQHTAHRDRVAADQGGERGVDGGEFAGAAGGEDAEQLIGRRGGNSAAGQLRTESVAGRDGAGDGAAGGLGRQLGDVVEGERLGAGERWRGAVEAAFLGQDRGGRFRQVGVRGSGDRAVGGQREQAALDGGAEEVQRARGVEAVPQRRPGHAAGAQRLLGGGMVAAGLETRCRAGPHLAGVEDAAGARRDGRVDRGAVLTWLSVPEERRDPALLAALREAMLAAVTNREPAVQDAGPAGAARALRAALPEQTSLSEAEQRLLREWLDRLAARPEKHEDQRPPTGKAKGVTI